MAEWPDNLQMRTIQTWPGERTPPEQRQHSRFDTPYGQTLDLLDRELYHLGAKDVWLEVAIQPEFFRKDGRPRASARADHPGVVISFRSFTLDKDLRYSTDRFLHWHDNLRAIALGLEALRKVERYGIANRGEQYAGWTQIGAGGPNKERGERIIQQFEGGFRAALKATHPDTRKDSYSDQDFADVMATRS